MRKKNVQQYCELSFQVPFDEIALKDIFRYGFNEHIKSWQPGKEINYPLQIYTDYTLMLSGSSFTVGVVEDDTEPLKYFLGRGCSSPDPGAMELGLSLSQTAQAIMTAIPEPQPVMAANPEPLHNMTTSPEPLHEMAAMPESPSITYIMAESSAIMDAKPVFPAMMNGAPEANKEVPRQPRLMSRVADPPLM